jgi:hypothetical protein
MAKWLRVPTGARFPDDRPHALAYLGLPNHHHLPRAGAPAGFPNLLTSTPWSNPANRPGSQTMPECRFNKFNATSIIHGKKAQKLCRSMIEHIKGFRMISEWSVVLSVYPIPVGLLHSGTSIQDRDSAGYLTLALPGYLTITCYTG